jgi:hypothetical protein
MVSGRGQEKFQVENLKAEKQSMTEFFGEAMFRIKYCIAEILHDNFKPILRTLSHFQGIV